MGQPAKVRPELRGACVDALAEASPQGQRAAKLRAGAEEALRQVRELQQLLLREQQQQQEEGQQPQQEQAPAPRGRLDPQQQRAAEERIRQLQRQSDELWRGADDLVAGEARRLLERAPVGGWRGAPAAGHMGGAHGGGAEQAH